MKKTILFLGCLLSFATMMQAEDLPAFPGAEGFARYITGGRGGKVYHVTNLNDSGDGSFRWAVGQSGARTIVFDVSGTIFLKSALALQNGNVTIAGQTAPGDGICIAGYPFTIKANNVIIRFLRFRLGNENVAYHEGDGLGGMDKSNIMVDHCSVSWSIDECLSVYGSKNITVQWCIASQSLRNSGHSKGTHGYGGNWGGSGASYHHNLICHHESRTPRLGPRPSTQSDERMDLRNNVIYNWAGNGCYGGEAMNVNMVNNYYKPGPATDTKSASIAYRIASPGIRTVDYCLDKGSIATAYNKVKGTTYTDKNVSGSASSDGTKNYVSIGTTRYEIDMAANTIDVDGTPVKVSWNSWKPTLHTWGKYFVDGNKIEGHEDVTTDNWTKGIYAQISNGSGVDSTYTQGTKDSLRIDEPIAFVATTTHTPDMAFEKVLKYVGACYARDALDSVMVADTRDRKATYSGKSFRSGSHGIIDTQNDCLAPGDTSAWPELKSLPAPADTDRDGMPDEWETENGLDPNDPADGNTLDADGYTMLEVYMNSLVADIMEGCTSDGELLGKTIDSSSSTEGTEVEISTSTAAGSEGTRWNFNGGYYITNNNGKEYATGNDNRIKFSCNVDFTVTIPDGKEILSAKIEGYDNYDEDSYLTRFGGEVDSTQYVFPAKEGGKGVVVSHTLDFDTPLRGSFVLRFGGKQTVVIITLTVRNIGTGAVEEIAAAPKDPNRLVDVYNIAGQCVRRQIPYNDIFTVLQRGFYIVEGEKIIVGR